MPWLMNLSSPGQGRNIFLCSCCFILFSLWNTGEWEQGRCRTAFIVKTLLILCNTLTSMLKYFYFFLTTKRVHFPLNKIILTVGKQPSIIYCCGFQDKAQSMSFLRNGSEIVSFTWMPLLLPQFAAGKTLGFMTHMKKQTDNWWK